LHHQGFLAGWRPGGIAVNSNLKQPAFWSSIAVLLIGVWGWSGDVRAQELEPRRWSHMPTGLNFIGLSLVHTEGDIYFDPVLEIEDATFGQPSASLVYLRSFGVFGKSARVDFVVPYVTARWEGLLQGQPASTRRGGFGDPRIRLSMLLCGGPAETPAEFAASEKSDWVVGAAVSLRMPYGHYEEDKPLNIGGNRWVLRPQLGITHVRGKWIYELTGSVFLYGDNDDFLVDRTLETDPLYFLQGHLIYTFRPGLWASLSTGYGDGANVSVNGSPADLKTEIWLTALSVGVPLNRQHGLKFTWLRSRTRIDKGSDSDSLIASWTMMFQ